MKHLWPLLIIVQLTAQIEVLPEGQAAFVQAMAMEQSGNLDGAIQIYNQILNGDPNNQPAYFQLRNIFSKMAPDFQRFLLLLIAKIKLPKC